MIKRKPEWLKVPPPWGKSFSHVRKHLKSANLHTVCEAANCPNIGECFNLGTATFLLMGDTCTRHCRFCNIRSGQLNPLDDNEPLKVAKAVKVLNLRFAVVTSVTRDDLSDGGAEHFARTIREIRRLSPETGIEVLIPDFKGNKDALNTVINAKPDVINHNVETVPRLYPAVRPEADYQTSLSVLTHVKTYGTNITVKSGFMLGMSETMKEVLCLLSDLQSSGCTSVTIGQYLPPSAMHYPLFEYVPPETFEKLAHTARELGFNKVNSGPLVRSSYHAGDD